MKGATRSFFLFIFLLTWGGVSFGQQILFRNYSVNDGLGSNTIWAISQDSEGYMWFGTKDGLNRFDGYNFKSFRYNKGNAKSLGSNFIHKILNFDKTHLWIATDLGVFILDMENETFTPIKALANKAVFDLMKDSKGFIWISTRNHGLYQYKPAAGKLKHYQNKNNDGATISSNQIRRAIEDDEGNIWIAAFGGGLDILDPVKQTFKHFKAGSKQGELSSNLILSLYKVLDGDIWIGTLAAGLNRWSKETKTFRRYVKSGANSINDNTVRSIYQTADGKLYIGTEKGLNIFYIKENRFTSYTVKNNDPYSISDNAIYTIFKDKEGGMWTGTYFGGVNYFREKSSGFELYYPTGDSNSLSGNAVSGFLEDKPGFFWVATEDGGLNYFNSYTKTFRQYPFKPDQQKLSYHNIHSLFKDKSGNIWIGTFTGGLNVYNPFTGKVKNYKHDAKDETSLSNNSIYTINQDKSGNIWVGTVYGLNMYDPVNDSFRRVTDLNMDKECVYAIHEDDAGNLWFATYDSGLVGKDKKAGRWVKYSSRTDGKSITSNKVISMMDDHAGNLWLGTDGGGLNVFNINKRTFRYIGSKEGINSDVIYGIVQDKSSNLWLSTNNGLYQYNTTSQNSLHYTKWDNLQSKQFNYKSSYVASDGKFYFGGVKGFNSFYPDSIKAVNYPPRVVLTNFQLFNKNVEIGQKNSPLQKIINFEKSVTLRHDQSVISFEYAALSFISPQKTEYAYKMDGFDKNWNYVGEQRKAAYTNLPAGNYTFKIKSTDNAGNWGGETQLKVEVLNPFYKTTFAYLIYLVIIIAGTIVIRRYLLTQADRTNQIRLERLKNKEEQEFYKQKIDFFTTMAHEIRTPLSLIIAPLERLMNFRNLDPAVSDHLQTMDENSERLQTLVSQLLDFRRIESDVYEIHKEKIEIVAMVQSLFTRFYPVAYQKGIKFSIETKISHLNVDADPEAMTKILSNLLINAFKFTRTKVKLKVLEPVMNELGLAVFSISVEDDGIGIPKDQVDNIFKKFFKVSSGQYDYSNLGGTGIGLALAKSLSEKHDGNLLVESLEGKKTVFTVQIPFAEDITSLKNDKKNTSALDQNEDGNQLILVAEDDLSMINFIIKSLHAEGYKAIGARNGKQALKLLDDHHVDLIVSDVMMPETDGMELCKTIKSDINFSHIPFILLTAKANSEAEILGFENGADAFIVKPFKWKHVSVVIKNLLDSRIKLKDKFSQQPLSDAKTLTTNTRDSKFIQKLIAIIEERITDPQLSVVELSKEMAMSRSSLHKKLKSMTGSVPNEFVRLIRLKHAAKLLALQEYNVSEVGYLAGFNSHSYFSKCFYQQFNQTPSEFAEKKRDSAPVS